MSFPGHKLNFKFHVDLLSRSPPRAEDTIDNLRIRTAFNGWCDVHDRAFITKREAKAAKAAKQEAAKRKAEKKARRKQASRRSTPRRTLRARRRRRRVRAAQASAPTT